MRDLAVAAAFEDAALAPLGVFRVWDSSEEVGYGAPGGGDMRALFPITEPVAPGPGFHLAFDAASHAVVDAFHAAALAAGDLAARRAYGFTTAPTTMPPSSPTPTATSSKPSANRVDPADLPLIGVSVGWRRRSGGSPQ